MKEPKVYIDELPESCSKCEWCTLNHKDNYGRPFCLMARMPLYNGDRVNEGRGQHKDSLSDFECPLHLLKTHDREKDKRIKELEQKVQELQEVDNKRAFRLYCMLYDMLEEKDPENVASRIDYLTGKDYSEMCELYKTAKNLKQHDRELVKEVCEKIRNGAVNMYYAEDQEDDSIEQAIVISRNEAVDEFIDILDQIQKEAENE